MEPIRGITRREALKRGAILGGALIWTTPVIQAVGMQAALAADVSPGCFRFALKWEIDGNSATNLLTCPAPAAQTIWTNNWTNLGGTVSNPPPGNCLIPPGDAINNGAAASNLTARPGLEFKVYGDPVDGFWVAFPDDCKPAVIDVVAAAKCGQGCREVVAFDLPDPLGEPDPCFVDYRRVFVDACLNGNAISHIELFVDFCP